MAMSPRLLRPLAQPKLLDFAPGAAAAYSLRQLSSSYAGPVVTVRRSSDSAEADFTAGQVSDGTLAAWVGSGNDGFVKTWHDQSGNGRDASQGTAANQPKIVDAGAVVTQASRPAISFDGSDDTLSASASYIGTGTATFVSVVNLNTLASAQTIAYAGNPSSNADYIYLFYDAGAYRMQARAGVDGSAVAVSPATADAYSLLFATRVATTTRIGANSVLGTATTDGENGVNVSGTLFLLSFRNAVWSAGKMQEFIIFSSDQSANRQRIEGDINRHYRIF